MAANTHDINFVIKTDETQLNRIAKRLNNVLGTALSQDIQTAIERAKRTVSRMTGEIHMTDAAKQLYGLDAEQQQNYDNLVNKRADFLKKIESVEAQSRQYRLQTAMREMSQSFVQMIGTGTTAAVTFAAPLRQAMKFESSLTNVAKVYDLTKKETDEFGESLLKLTTKIPVATDKIGALAYNIAQLGIPRGEIMPFVELAAKAGMALDIPTEEIGTLIGRARAAYNIKDVQGIKDMLDYVNEASNKISAKPLEILTATTRIGAISSSYGLDSKQSAALASVLLNAGWLPEATETGLKDLITNMQTLSKKGPNTEVGKEWARLSTLNKNQYDYLLQQRDVLGALQLLLGSMKGKPENEVANTLYLLFGQQHAGKIAGMVKSGEKLDELLEIDRKGTYKGSMEKEFLRVLATATSSWELAENALRRLAISVGATLLPTLKTVLLMFNNITNSISDLMKNEAIQPFVSLATHIGAVVGVLAVAVPAIKLFKSVLSMIGLSIGGGKFGLFTKLIIGVEAVTGLMKVLNGESTNFIEKLSMIIGLVMSAKGVWDIIQGILLLRSSPIEAAKKIGIGVGELAAVGGLAYAEQKYFDSSKQLEEAQEKLSAASKPTEGGPTDSQAKPVSNNVVNYHDNRTINIQAASEREIRALGTLPMDEFIDEMRSPL